jgi:hypothetical protein
MKIRSLIAGVLIAVTLGAGASFAGFQGRVFFDVPFEFTAGDITFPAGRYEVELATPNQFSTILRNTATGNAVVVPSSSRLAARDVALPELVFDQASGHMHLSEIYVAPGVDGYYITGAKGPHTHKVIQGTK